MGIREGLRIIKPDVLVVGARLEEGDSTGFDITREIRASHPKVNVVLILDSSQPATVVEAFRAGAGGIFCRDQSSDQLSECIHAVHLGRVWASTQQLHFLIDALAPIRPSKPVFA